MRRNVADKGALRDRARGIATTALAGILCLAAAGCGKSQAVVTATTVQQQTSTTTQQQTSTATQQTRTSTKQTSTATQQTSTATQHTGTSTTKTAAPGAKGSNSGTPSKAKALAYAQAVNLRAGDVPGFKEAAPEHEQSSKAEERREEELQRCTGAPGGEDGIAEASSPKFERKPSAIETETASSSVSVVRREAEAARVLAVLKRDHTGSCLESYVRLALKPPKGETIVTVATAKIAAPANSFGWRILISLKIRDVSLPIQFDFLGFVRGRAEITLTTIGVGEIFPPATERHLVSLLMERAKSGSI